MKILSLVFVSFLFTALFFMEEECPLLTISQFFSSPKKYLGKRVCVVGHFWNRDPKTQNLFLKEDPKGTPDRNLEVFYNKVPQRVREEIEREPIFSGRKVVVKGEVKRYEGDIEYFIVADEINF